MKTKKLVAVLLLILGSAVTFSQNSKTLTNDDLFLWKGNSFYGAIDYNWSNADGKIIAVNGVKLIFPSRHHLGVGLGFSSVNQNKLTQYKITNLHYGGPELGYFLFPHKLVFPSVHLFSGLAYCSDCNHTDRLFWFIEPGVKVWLNVASFMRFSINSNYRNFQEKPNFNTKALNGFNFGFSVAYGKF